jgi:phosphoglycolate phosphatase
MTAHNAGLPCIGVTWGFRSRQVLEENNAEFIVDSPEKIADCLQ